MMYLSSPHMSGDEMRFLTEAFESNWIAPLGPHVEAFEEEFARALGSPHGLAVVSGTAALHLALRLVGVGRGDPVIISDLTFVATANPVLYQGAKPIFVDSDRSTWNMSPALFAEAVEDRVRAGPRPAAVILVHLYGQPADTVPILEICRAHGIPLIEDAAEALGATYRGAAVGTLGDFGVFSFNGNKIITTSGGGMLIGGDGSRIEAARKLATQARDPAPHYQHSELGYNYRMSNLLAAVGRGQLQVLHKRVAARRQNFEFYRRNLRDLPGIEFMPEAPERVHTRWLTTLTINPAAFGADREAVRLALLEQGIEARPLWKPMHMQPLYNEAEMVGGDVSEALFRDGLCLPSGSNLTTGDLEQVVEIITGVHRSGAV